VIYSGEGFSWTSDEALVAANPNLNVSVYRDTLIEERNRAITNPALQSVFRSHHLCEWLGSASAWLDPMKVSACREQKISMEMFKHWFIGEPGVAASDEARPFVLGADMASRQDILALVFTCMSYVDGAEHFYSFGRYYLPAETVETSPIAQYRAWAKRGLIQVMPGFSNDYQVVENDILAMKEAGFKISLAAYDSWQAEMLAQNLEKGGIATVPFPKTSKAYSPTMDWMTSLILAGRWHFPFQDEVMRWALCNVVAKRDAAENLYPRRVGDDPNRKIDPAVAVLYSARAAMTDSGNVLRHDTGSRVTFIFEDGSVKQSGPDGHLVEWRLKDGAQ
jgi:phage terminase large subunit-like protein